ncbi:acidic leucine-rich nuclear phosphoprotein 32 family member E isoform X2 [Takifugu flavidus]|uniref:acidic leucine-rich nuclear phosphoprotein 32 family member E isoform X2 n=1 Tax=Takifugu flavidus TaxID=433684 RepID=UPI0025444AEE|nr:acidic leucine-rich nuclear phosphoprotein 32 family member E isoform X2 [Takifugu flavidus]
MDMKNRVRLELRNRSPAEVLELILDNCRSTDGEIEGLTNEFSELEYLSLVNVGLGSLAKVPSLPKLRKLDLSYNNLSGALEKLTEKCPNLTHLNLSGNKIQDLTHLETLNLKNLRSLELLNCDITSVADYRDGVFQLLPQVTYLDGFDCDDNEASNSDDDDDDESEEGAELPAGYHDEDDEHKDEDDAEVGHEGWSFHTRPGHEDEENDEEEVACTQGQKRKRSEDDENNED